MALPDKKKVSFTTFHPFSVPVLTVQPRFISMVFAPNNLLVLFCCLPACLSSAPKAGKASGGFPTLHNHTPNSSPEVRPTRKRKHRRTWPITCTRRRGGSISSPSPLRSPSRERNCAKMPRGAFGRFAPNHHGRGKVVTSRSCTATLERLTHHLRASDHIRIISKPPEWTIPICQQQLGSLHMLHKHFSYHRPRLPSITIFPTFRTMITLPQSVCIFRGRGGPLSGICPIRFEGIRAFYWHFLWINEINFATLCSGVLE